ncbi:hypothetical protein DFJ73DRAFT_917486 [Zopfochytrium polystomum]|nr:hypothetical protein DFJ73DRAFT_917486 [Zopfochytrium polystomum]
MATATATATASSNNKNHAPPLSGGGGGAAKAGGGGRGGSTTSLLAANELASEQFTITTRRSLLRQFREITRVYLILKVGEEGKRERKREREIVREKERERAKVVGANGGGLANRFDQPTNQNTITVNRTAPRLCAVVPRTCRVLLHPVTLSVQPGAPSIDNLPFLTQGCQYGLSDRPCTLIGYTNGSIPTQSLNPVIQNLASLVAQAEPLDVKSYGFAGASREILRPFDSVDALRQYQAAYPSNIVVGVEFKSLAVGQANYSIWINDTVFVKDYISTYFISAQAYVNRAVINVARTSAGLPPHKSPLLQTDANGVRTASVASSFNAISAIMAYYFVLMFQSIPGNVLLRMSQNKVKLRPGLVMMGMDETVDMLSICLVQFLFSLPIIIAVVYSSWSLLLVTLLLFCAGSIFFGVILSVLFPDPRQAAGMNLLALIATLAWYAIGEIFIFGKLAVALQRLWLIFPQAALARVIRQVGLTEQSGRGVGWGTGDRSAEVAEAVVMLVVDIFVWFALAWYFNLRYPGNGVGRFPVRSLPRLFFLRKDFWYSDRRATVTEEGEASAEPIDQPAGNSAAATTEHVDGDFEEEVTLEPEDLTSIPSSRRFAVRVENVRKVFAAGKEKPKSLIGLLISTIYQTWKKKRNPAAAVEEKKSQEKVALEGVSMSLHAGQILSLLGHNGAGKTTLISILCGSLEPTRGSVTIRVPSAADPSRTDVLKLARLADVQALRNSIGVCPQFDVLYPQLSSKEHLRLYAALKGVHATDVAGHTTDATMDAYLTALLIDAALAPAKHSARSETLSGGEQRKLTVACALVGAPAILLLDEPTTGMDVTATASVWRLLRAVAGASSESGRRRRGCAVLLTTHSMEEAEALGDRVVVMGRRGRVRAAGGALFLKARLGGGRRLVVGLGESTAHTAAATAPPAGADAVLRVVRQSVPNAYVEGQEVDGDGAHDETVQFVAAAADGPELSPAHDTSAAAAAAPPASATTSSSSVDSVRVVLPDADPENPSDLTAMFRALRDALAAGALPGVASVGLEQATLEDVFIKLKEVDDTSTANGESK